MNGNRRGQRRWSTHKIDAHYGGHCMNDREGKDAIGGQGMSETLRGQEWIVPHTMRH